MISNNLHIPFIQADTFSRRSVQTLIVANMIPLIGVVFFEWSLFAIMYLYWLENVIIGVFNVLRMSRAEGVIDPKHTIEMGDKPYTDERRTALIVFFVVHYGIFTTVHGAFISIVFGPYDIGLISALAGVLGLIVSHWVSYVTNYIGAGEYKKVSAPTLFILPYKRIIILHMSIIFGGFLVFLLGVPTIALGCFIFMKTWVDVWLHTREHDGLRSTEEAILTSKI
jgi:hypothetical protein